MLQVFEGVIIGLTLAILIGPIFITLTQISMQGGVKAGITAGLGVWISDIIVILLAWWGTLTISHWLHHPSFFFWQSIIGGIIFIAIGLVSVFSKKNHIQPSNSKNLRSRSSYFTKGFLVNFVNPFTFVFWLTIFSNYMVQSHTDKLDLFLIISSIMATIIVTDSLKVILSKKISIYLKPNHLIIFNKTAGAMLIIFGVVFIVRAL